MRQLDELLSRLQVPCGRMGLLEEALTHRSYAQENPGLTDNERLEFFGDSVLKFVISEYLLERFPEHDEGQLSEIRAVLVSTKSLAKVAENVDLGKNILTGRRVPLKPSILAGALEAVLGAIYFDSGLIHVQTLIIRLLGGEATLVDKDSIRENYKAALQEYTQARSQGIPIYSVLKTEGLAHEPTFYVGVSIGEEQIAEGKGLSKKAAEQEAARAALAKLSDSEK